MKRCCRIGLSVTHMRVYILASAKRQRCTPEFDDGRYLCVAHAIRINQTYVNWMKGNPKGILRVWMVKARFPVDILFTHWWVSMMKYDLICPPVFVCSTTETQIYIYIINRCFPAGDATDRVYRPSNETLPSRVAKNKVPTPFSKASLICWWFCLKIVIPWLYHGHTMVIPPKWWQFYSKRWWYIVVPYVQTNPFIPEVLNWRILIPSTPSPRKLLMPWWMNIKCRWFWIRLL